MADPSTPPPAFPGARPDDPVFDQAEQWAARRKAPDLCVELYVRIVQLTMILLGGFRNLGLDQMGNPVQKIVADPATGDLTVTGG